MGVRGGKEGGGCELVRRLVDETGPKVEETREETQGSSGEGLTKVF